MSLSAAFNIISSSFATNAAQTSVVSRNIANVNTPGYSREIANVVTNGYGGSDVGSITRQTNRALLEQTLDSTSQAASSQALADGLATLSQTVNDSASATTPTGAAQNGQSPSAMLANLQSALQTYAASPDNASTAQAVVDAANNLTGSLNNASTAVQSVRSQADSKMAASVANINSLLGQFYQANTSVVTGLQVGADVSTAQDTRDNLLRQLSQQIGISTINNPNGSISIYTDSGVPLFQNTPSTLTFTPTPTLVAGSQGNAVLVNGVPITGASAPMALQTGALAGYATLRDVVAPQYQTQLDQIAGGLVSAFAETDQSATPTLPALPGLFTFPGATGIPAVDARTGLAASIRVNANVDPAQGGNVYALRDGGISAPGNPAYVYNATSAASFSDRISQLSHQISSAQTFGQSGTLGTSNSLSGYASDSVSWIQNQYQQATNQADYASAVASQAASALSSATGVNLDTEMTNMLNLENTYTTTAKLLTTVNSMLSTLINAV